MVDDDKVNDQKADLIDVLKVLFHIVLGALGYIGLRDSWEVPHRKKGAG
jgi:hypothetical protein